MTGTIIAIFTASAAQAPTQSVPTAQLEAGRGIVGDRYYSSDGTFSEKLEGKGNSDWEVTLIETEEIDRFNEAHGHELGYGDFRRNIATRDIRLNSLVAKQFDIGGVKLAGIRLCEPCDLRQRHLRDWYLLGYLRRRYLRCLQHRVGW